ncbi:MAG TPA: DEAD/DEAH box helicase, partial [Verrucomicrobiales bacterium]|nr:DEAD/DEAH box helicase [Verrucomicrobiales bacterium]
MALSGFPINLSLPDLWQQEAVRYLKAGRDVIVDAPTGAGKTHVFELLVDAGIRGQAIYTVPTRALANDKRLEWQRKGWDVGIVTGDLSENPTAPVVVATLETQREKLLHGDGPSVLVIDEYQMLADPVRGLAYELAMVLAPVDTRLLLLSGSVGNARDVAEWLRRLGRNVEVVATATRPVPLE